MSGRSGRKPLPSQQRVQRGVSPRFQKEEDSYEGGIKLATGKGKGRPGPHRFKRVGILTPPQKKKKTYMPQKGRERDSPFLSPPSCKKEKKREGKKNILHAVPISP